MHTQGCGVYVPAKAVCGLSICITYNTLHLAVSQLSLAHLTNTKTFTTRRMTIAN